MLEVIKKVVCENGLEYETTINARQFYSEQIESVENGTILDLGKIEPIEVETEELYNELGMHEFLNTNAFYNYNTYVCLKRIKHGLAFNCEMLEQDKEDYQHQAFITLFELFSKEEKEYSFSDFNYLCNVVSNRIMKKITYAFHRFEMDSAFNLTKEVDGVIVAQTLENLIEERDGYQTKQQNIQEKAYNRGIHAMELLEELDNCLSYAENDRLKKYLSMKVDGVKLATKERVDLHRICKKIENYKIEMNTKARELRNDTKKAWIELLDAKKQEKKVQKQIQAETRREYRNNKVMNADKNLATAKEQVTRRLLKLKASATEQGLWATVSQLLEVQSRVNACPSQKKLRDLRKELNEVSYVLGGLNQEQIQNLKELKAKAKALMNG